MTLTQVLALQIKPGDYIYINNPKTGSMVAQFVRVKDDHLRTAWGTGLGSNYLVKYATTALDNITAITVLENGTLPPT